MSISSVLHSAQMSHNYPDLKTLSSHPILNKALTPNSDKILKNAHHCRQDIVKDLKGNLSWHEFTLFLTLFPYGQPLAKNFSSVPLAHYLSLKEALEQSPQKEFLNAIKEIGISDEKISLFWDLLSFDTHALCIKDHVSKNEVLDVLYEKASKAKIEPEVFYAIAHKIHTLNSENTPPSFLTHIQNFVAGLLEKITPNLSAAIAPKVAAPSPVQKKIDTVIQHLFNSRTGEALFHSLVKEVANKQSPIKVKETFRCHLYQLQCFLEKAHKEMLNSTGCTTPEQKRKFREIKRGFRDILVYIQEDTNPKSTTTYDPREFAHELITFRRDYLCRYSLHKVELAIGKTQGKKDAKSRKKVSNKMKKPLTATPKLSSFFNLTFIHGTNAALLQNLEASDNHLLCTGRLHRVGIIPFSGELGNGILNGGVNSYEISGTSLKKADVAINYATCSSATSLEKEITEIKSFLDYFKEMKDKQRLFTLPDQTSYHVGEWMRLSMSIKRMRTLYTDEWRGYEERVKSHVEKLHSEWQLYKQSDNYWENMPVDRYGRANEVYTHWDYYFNQADFAIQSLKNALTEEVKTVATPIEHTFPILFASNTIHTRFRRAMEESCAQKACKIGKDIQFIFVHDKDKPVIESFVKKAKISATIHNFDLIRQASHVVNLADSYLSTYSKKLRRGVLCFL